jgi:predicted dehydrogenase
MDSIANGTPPLVTALDGLMSVQLVNAVYESVRTDATITVRPYL